MLLDQIKTFLHDHHLNFLGFEIETEVQRAYQLRFPDDRAATNLDQWQTFEQENPDTFGNMYQLWMQKALCPSTLSVDLGITEVILRK